MKKTTLAIVLDNLFNIGSAARSGRNLMKSIGDKDTAEELNKIRKKAEKLYDKTKEKL